VSHSDPHEIAIRDATASDAGTVHDLIVALADTMPGHTVVKTTPEHFRRQLSAQQPFVHALLAERGGRALGLCLWLDYFSSWRGPGIYIQDLYVAAEERGSGLGRRLIARAAADGAVSGARFIRLAVDIANARAVPFYDRLGFTETIEDRMFMLFDEAFDRLATEGANGKREQEG